MAKKKAANRRRKKKYTSDDLQIIDDLDFIRTHPEMNLSRTVPDPAMIASDIALDAITLGATDVRIFKFQDWWIVNADKDWLNAPCRRSVSPTEAFQTYLPFPELGVNTIHHEILATAFAQAVVSLSATDRFVVQGNIVDDDPVWQKMQCENVSRSVALRMDGAGKASTMPKTDG